MDSEKHFSNIRFLTTSKLWHFLLAEYEYPIRLTDGHSSTEGRVEILFNGQWGLVCNTDWTSVQAGVVCRQLGFSGQSVPVHERYGRETPTVHLRNVDCKGDETRLTDCSFYGWVYHSSRCSGVVLSVICLTGN